MTKRPKSIVVSVLGFSPCLQQGNETSAEPHNSSALPDGRQVLSIPPGANAVMVQARTQNIFYTLTPSTNPTATAGFLLTAGNDPIILHIDPQTTRLAFFRAAAGAILEFQFGRM